MRNIVCFSGDCIYLGEAHRLQLKNWFDGYFDGEYFVIGHVRKDAHKEELISAFQDAVVQVEDNVPIDQSGIVNLFEKDHRTGFRTGIQRYLQQIHSYRKVNSLRKTLFESRPTDRVVRCRYDLKFYSSPFLAEKVTNDEIGIPDFHHWYGYNDRMAIMGGNVSDYYLNIIDNILADKSKCIHPERNLKRVLDSFDVGIKMLSVRFNRMRSEHLESQDCSKIFKLYS